MALVNQPHLAYSGFLITEISNLKQTVKLMDTQNNQEKNNLGSSPKRQWIKPEILEEDYSRTQSEPPAPSLPGAPDSGQVS